ncbi:MAG: hypothetical protein DBY32_09355 [Phascolarctobacterium sp.]|nr:MAG: hypothetical protein DBY32_09355 [Phascolarctobacterium sp.]
MSVDKVPIWNKAVLSSEEAAEYSNLALVYIQAHAYLAKCGQSDFPCFWVGKSIKVHRQALDKWLEELAYGHQVLELARVRNIIKNMDKLDGLLVKRRGRPRKQKNLYKEL